MPATFRALRIGFGVLALLVTAPTLSQEITYVAEDANLTLSPVGPPYGSGVPPYAPSDPTIATLTFDRGEAIGGWPNDYQDSSTGEPYPNNGSLPLSMTVRRGDISISFQPFCFGWVPGTTSQQIQVRAFTFDACGANGTLANLLKPGFLHESMATKAK